MPTEPESLPWNAIPRFVTEPEPLYAKRVAGAFLPEYTEAFQFDGDHYTATIFPARRPSDGLQVYPSSEEERVETGLRSLTLVLFDRLSRSTAGNLVLPFYVSELAEQIEQPRISEAAITDALHVLSGSFITITNSTNSSSIRLSYLASLSNFAAYGFTEEQAEEAFIVEFNSLLTAQLRLPGLPTFTEYLEGCASSEDQDTPEVIQ